MRAADEINSQVPSDWSFMPLDAPKAWLLGLLFGDGSIRRDLCQVTVTSGDLDVLDKINALFGDRLHIRKNKGCSIISVNSQRLARQLIAHFGLAPHKAASMLYPAEVPVSLESHFIRGLLDSDGCWKVDQRRQHLAFVYASQSKLFIDALKARIGMHLDISKRIGIHVDKRRDKMTYSFHYSHQDAIRIGQWLYTDSISLRCERKYLRWASFAL